ncbi:putative mannosyltransferase [Burkholderiales bacterium GJ-E10]|nr:putative mannosyltransferase [Burkholderiales bacterium GJ-E10]
MTTRLNLYCHFNHTGVGRHSENIHAALAKRIPADMELRYLDMKDEAAVAKAIAESRDGLDVTIFFWRQPVEFVRRFRGRRVLWWAFESDLLPKAWLDQVEPYDEIWVPSGWGQAVLHAHGIPDERIRVVAEGVDPTVYCPEPLLHRGFIFLSVGKYERRKSIDEIVAAFGAEFPADRYPEVRLWLKADYPLYPHRVQELSERVRDDGRIRIISGVASDETISKLYRVADAFVFPSKAEGFGLPCIEAIACGVPVIATNVSGQSAFLERIPGLFVPVVHERAPIVDPDYSTFYRADYGNDDFGNWAIPSMASLRAAMRTVYENPAEWRKRADEAAAVIRREFSWDAVARNVIAASRR